jgi:hypothetical protein
MLGAEPAVPIVAGWAQSMHGPVAGTSSLADLAQASLLDSVGGMA